MQDDALDTNRHRGDEGEASFPAEAGIPLRHAASAGAGNANLSSERAARSRTNQNLFTFDRTYVQKLAQGDSTTERHFIDYFSPLLFAKLHFQLRFGQEIQDLRQEVFLRVLRCLRQGAGIQQPERLGAYVNSVCNNVLMEYFRHKSRVKQLDENAPDVEDSRTDLERDLVTEENRMRVRSLVAKLAPKERHILKAIFFEEREKESVCREFGVTRGYLRVLLHRAKEQLRRVSAVNLQPGGNNAEA
jgi:RNA polymerase sigma-70 factor (ECF subfamily)